MDGGAVNWRWLWMAAMAIGLTCYSDSRYLLMNDVIYDVL
jgi:hypothetical protein